MVKEKLQTFGKAMLVPLSLIALGGLFLGIGGAMTSKVTVSSIGLNWDSYQATIFFDFFNIVKVLGETVFKNLSILYAVGIAFSLSKREQGMAAFSAAVAYLAMQMTISTLLARRGYTASTTTIDHFISQGYNSFKAAELSALFTTELGFFTYRTGIFGDIVVGLAISQIHKKYSNTKLPTALAFFSGTRTVPIMSLISGGVIGGAFFVFWPRIGGVLSSLALFIQNSGLVGTFVYRSVYESLIPFGMHSIVGVPMRWTELGGKMLVDGNIIVGNSAIQLAQLASPEPGKLLVRAFMAGMAIMNFAGYPGAALAIYHTAKPENKKKIAGLLIPTIIATTLFGITEPIMFTFLFVAPWLYFLVHVPLAAFGEVLSEYFSVSIYQGNLKDWLPFFFRPEKLNMYPFLFLMLIFFFAYYFLFKFLILKFNVQTPGREESIEGEEIKLYTRKDYEKKQKENLDDKNSKLRTVLSADEEFAQDIIFHLGGKENIEELDNCISRLRIIVKNPELVSDDFIWKNEMNAAGVVRSGKALQVIYGPKVPGISADVREILGY